MYIDLPNFSFESISDATSGNTVAKDHVSSKNESISDTTCSFSSDLIDLVVYTMFFTFGTENCKKIRFT